MRYELLSYNRPWAELLMEYDRGDVSFLMLDIRRVFKVMISYKHLQFAQMLRF
jgi:hypothetical protein